MAEDTKPRLRWTPALHKCFVSAIYSLGGPIKAKPKTLVQEMKVPGINLDHIKSHLQKYRIALRKLQQQKTRQKRQKSIRLRHQKPDSTSSTASSHKNATKGSSSESSTSEIRQANQPDEAKAELLMEKSQSSKLTFSSDELDEAFNMISDEDIATILDDFNFSNGKPLPPSRPSNNASGDFGSYYSPIMTEAIDHNSPRIADYLAPFEPVPSPDVGVGPSSGNSTESGGDFLSSCMNLEEAHKFFDEMGW